MTAQVISVDRRTQTPVAVVGDETSTDSVDDVCQRAAAATPALAALGRLGRAALLRQIAHAVMENRDSLTQVADRETALGTARLESEVRRVSLQMRLFADAVEDGAWLEATIDHACETEVGPQPDLRRMLVAIGPVGVFAASNFPLAFSVPGGDTIAAIAAGCPVVVKAHGLHPATSALCHELMTDVMRRAGAPEDALSLVYGVQAGADVVQHPAIRAVAFTGSLAGGNALMRMIGERADPIPFYGELGSINPVVVTSGAARARAQEIGIGLAESVALGNGQFCTKPGLVFVPAGADGDRLVHALADTLDTVSERILLGEGITAGFYRGSAELLRENVVLVAGDPPAESGAVTAYVVSLNAEDLRPRLLEEVFGPTTVVVRFDHENELVEALQKVPGSLTGTIHAQPEEHELARTLEGVLRSRCGRLIFNGYPTGVAVAWAQHHGGPWPATNTLHTSVGTTAMRRFLRPVAWQAAPHDLLPEELRDDAPGLPRRVDGELVLVPWR